MPTVLFESPHVLITVEAALSLVAFTRTSLPIETIAAGSGHAMLRALTSVDRSTHTLLIDLRLAPMRDDSVGARYGIDLERLFGGFRRRAVLVASAVGALQVNRHLRDEKTRGEAAAFRDEAAARAYLQDSSRKLR